MNWPSAPTLSALLTANVLLDSLVTDFLPAPCAHLTLAGLMTKMPAAVPVTPLAQDLCAELIK